MKRNRFTALFTMLLGVALLASAQSPKPRVFKGEVADSSCAFNVHSLTRSHQEMLKAKGTGTDAASCSRYCVKNFGADFVLVDGQNVYRLADQPHSFWEGFAGKKVAVHGVLDAKTRTIHVDRLQ